MAIIWEPRFEPSEEPQETISSVDSQEDLNDWNECAMDGLGDLLYGDTEDTETVKEWIRKSGRGFGN